MRSSKESPAVAVAKTPSQILLAGPITPPPSSEAPGLPLPAHTSIIVSEEAPSGWMTLYRGHVSSTGSDARLLEEVLPLWLLECLLQNKVPAIPVSKISFVLLPYKEPEGEQLPELLNTYVSSFLQTVLLLTCPVQCTVEADCKPLFEGAEAHCACTSRLGRSFSVFPCFDSQLRFRTSSTRCLPALIRLRISLRRAPRWNAGRSRPVAAATTTAVHGPRSSMRFCAMTWCSRSI